MSPPIGCAHETLTVAIPGSPSSMGPEGSLIENDHGSGVPDQSPGVRSVALNVDVRDFQIIFK